MSLVIIGALGAFRLAINWLYWLTGPLTLPLLVAFLIFNVGFLWAGTTVRFRSLGAKLGAAAVALNLATILLPPVAPFFWSAISVSAIAIAFVGGALLFNDGKRTAA